MPKRSHGSPTKSSMRITMLEDAIRALDDARSLIETVCISIEDDDQHDTRAANMREALADVTRVTQIIRVSGGVR